MAYRHFKVTETNPMDIVPDKAFERSNQSFKATLVNLNLGKLAYNTRTLSPQRTWIKGVHLHSKT